MNTLAKPLAIILAILAVFFFSLGVNMFMTIRSKTNELKGENDTKDLQAFNTYVYKNYLRSEIGYFALAIILGGFSGYLFYTRA
jgi:hypothetical protein